MTTPIRLPKEVKRRLNVLTEKTGRTEAFYIREMILNHIDDMEGCCLAAEVIKRLREGRERTFSAHEVRRHFCAHSRN